MAGSIAEYLKRTGLRLSEDAFLTIVEESIDRVVGSGAEDSDLPPDERKRLEEGGFSFRRGAHTSDDPIARGAAEFAALMGSALSVNQVAKRLGVNATRVRQRISERSVYGVKRDGEWFVPRFQFGRRALIPGIGRVISALDPHLHPVAVHRWFTSPQSDIGTDDAEPMSPLEWLRTGGDPEELVPLASDL